MDCLEEGRGPQTDKPAAKSLYRSIFKKRLPLGYGVFIIIWSMRIAQPDKKRFHWNIGKALVLETTLVFSSPAPCSNVRG